MLPSRPRIRPRRQWHRWTGAHGWHLVCGLVYSAYASRSAVNLRPTRGSGAGSHTKLKGGMARVRKIRD
jgi:hypothetical protein